MVAENSKNRLDIVIFRLGLATTRSQAENMIRLGFVTVDKKIIKKPGYFVNPTASSIKINVKHNFLNRGELKLASISKKFNLNFKNKIVLDIGSSTGGFSNYALEHGAGKIYAVDVGTNQMIPALRHNSVIELHEKTDIRDFEINDASLKPDIILIDVSFISICKVLPHVFNDLSKPTTEIVAMVKPQFETQAINLKDGVVKNEKIRRQILKSFENWAKRYFVIKNKQDSGISGKKGNLERFYLLTIVKH